MLQFESSIDVKISKTKFKWHEIAVNLIQVLDKLEGIVMA